MPELKYDLRGKRVWVAGHKGMVGSAIVRGLADEGCEIVTADRMQLDLRRQADVFTWFEKARPDAVFMAAAKVGGILANDTYPADFLYDNLAIQNNVIHACQTTGVEKLVYLGSSCIYPKFAKQPITEDELLTGPLEPTNEWYAIAKIAGIKLCQAYRRQYGSDFVSAMPTNLFGPGDNFDLTTSHVLPALIRKTFEAKRRGDKEIVVWGSGTPRREFLHVDDCADACIFVMKHYSAESHINVGSGEDITILGLAELVAREIGWDGRFVLDRSKPDGTPRKLMSPERLQALGWKPKKTLEQGIREVCAWYAEELAPAI